MSESGNGKIVDDTCGCVGCVSERQGRQDEQVIKAQADRLREMRRINAGLAGRNAELIAERDRLAGQIVSVEAENVELRRQLAEAAPNGCLAPPKARRPTVTLYTPDGDIYCMENVRTIGIEFPA